MEGVGGEKRLSMCGCMISHLNISLTVFSWLGFSFSNQHVCVVEDMYVEEGGRELLSFLRAVFHLL